MRAIYDCITTNRLTDALELGSWRGATSCVMAAAAQEIGGTVTSVDILLQQPANVRSLAAHAGIGPELELVIDPLGYNWYMADLIRKQTDNGICTPMFDFCFLDGAHEWQPDALAVYLAVKLLKPGGVLVLDDLNLKLRAMSHWQITHSHLSDRELDEYQIGMVWDLVVKQHSDLHGFRVTEDGRIGWRRSVRCQSRKPPNGRDFSLGCSRGSESSITRRCRRLTAIAVMRGFRKAAGGFRYVRTASSRSCRRPVVPR